jgi:hypothetical protein
MNHRGDTRIEYDAGDPEAVAQAQERQRDSLSSIHGLPSMFAPSHCPLMRATPQNSPEPRGRLLQSSTIPASCV